MISLGLDYLQLCPFFMNIYMIYDILEKVLQYPSVNIQRNQAIIPCSFLLKDMLKFMSIYGLQTDDLCTLSNYIYLIFIYVFLRVSISVKLR